VPTFWITAVEYQPLPGRVWALAIDVTPRSTPSAAVARRSCFLMGVKPPVMWSITTYYEFDVLLA
jgi:hypothetical protein